ncbi:Ras-related protein Rab-4B [Symbiodinium microadriaticum]|uniref:Ras-related protein Rab-4B n=1 Tax=Symbiodinium microadriaticum TaxID=2951 RepID=A0A1Q9EWN6_SYMMI|nr:Ras-related protein Rab-4B [Symbiodinium microadriaticum]
MLCRRPTFTLANSTDTKNRIFELSSDALRRRAAFRLMAAENDKDKYDYLFKFIIIGDAGAGKIGLAMFSCLKKLISAFEIRRGNMSITVAVGLLSGKTATVKADLDEQVGTLKRRAENALGVGRARLVDSSGVVLDACAPIKRTRLQNGDSLTFHISRVQVQASRGAFAAILGDGTVTTWGNFLYGADSSAVQDQLKNVQQVQASLSAFAAVLGDGSVVTWGHAGFGGDSSAVQNQLRNVRQIQASYGAFAAILGDGSVVTWGDAEDGADSSAVQDQLKNVQQVQASLSAFAAVLGDGSVVTWGHAGFGGDSRAVQNQLRNVRQIQVSYGAFAAILVDGSVVTWGIQASEVAFAAILGDGSVVSCLLHQFIDNKFKKGSSHTIGVEFGSKIITVGGRNIKLQIWDTAGQDRYRSVTRSYYRGAAGALIVYDITNRDSYNHLVNWLADARSLSKIYLMAVEEQEKREVTFLEASRCAQENDILFLETSALTGEGVEDVFIKVARMILNKIEDGLIDPLSMVSGIHTGLRIGEGGSDAAASKTCSC